MRYNTVLTGPELLARRVRGVCLECALVSTEHDAATGFTKDLYEGCLTAERKERAKAKKAAEQEKKNREKVTGKA